MSLDKATQKTEMLVLNKDGKSIGTKEVFITRDFMYFVNEIGSDKIEICFVKPITERRPK